MNNTDLLRRLFDEGKLNLQRAALFNTSPPPLAEPIEWDRVEGMLLGLAIGDALGRTSEGLLPQVRWARHGEIRDYRPNPNADGRAVGLPSDDTQLAFWTLEQLLADDGLNPEHVAQRFMQGHIYGIGQTVLRFIVNMKAGRPWHEAGPESAGNGALMRIAPVLLPHLRDPSPALWADTALLAMITHNDPASTGSCVAFVKLLRELLGSDSPPAAEWWLETFCGTLEPLEGDTRYRPRVGYPGEAALEYEGPLWRFARTQVRQALEENLPVVDACNRWYSGAYLLETVPSVLYILCRYGHDPEEAIARAVNDSKDNDTIAAIVGAAVGALHGRGALPQRWIDGLLGRTTADDDGRVFELLEQARARWG
jgi:ADP-ribosyl-[dinitrogen reductase] hydrolase